MFRLAFAPCPKLRDLGIRQPLDADELVLALADPDEFVQFRLHRGAVAVLRALDQEHHQEGYDGRACVDDQLPGLGEAEKRAADRPDDDRQSAKHECRRLARPPRNGVGEMRKDFFHGTPPAVETPVSTQRQTTVDVPKFVGTRTRLLPKHPPPQRISPGRRLCLRLPGQSGNGTHCPRFAPKRGSATGAPVGAGIASAAG